MRLPLLLVLAPLLLMGTAPLSSQVLVTAPRLSGYWMVTGPNLIQFQVGLFSGIRILYSGQTDTRDICLLQHQTAAGFAAICSAGLFSMARGHVNRDHVRLEWWSGPANLIFNGTWDEGATIAGVFTGGLAGIPVTGGIPASLHKLPLPAGTGNAASLNAARNVIADLQRGILTAPWYEPGAIKRVWRAEHWPDAKSGPHSLVWLGTIHVHWQQKQPDLVEQVYEVRSARMLSLCRIALSARGLVDDFACHAGPPAG